MELQHEIVCQAVRQGATLPERMTEGAAGWDLRACLDAAVTLAPGDRRLIPTGLSLSIPSGREGAIRPRSGLALRHGIGVLNSPGTIDSDYRGEVQIILINWGAEPFVVENGARIAQIVFQRLPGVAVVWGTVGETDRGAGGFGHTGLGASRGEDMST